jgi:hypothetical protein
MFGARQKHRHFFAVMIKLFRDHAVIDAFFVQLFADAAQCAVQRGDALLHRQF